MPTDTPREGDVIAWIVCDPDTLEACVRCTTRAEARELAGSIGIVAKLVRTH